MSRVFLAVAAILLAAASAHADWKDSSEAGVVVTSGNSKTMSYNLKSSTQYLFDLNTLQLDGSYLQSRNKGVTSAQSWLIGLRFERALSNQWSAFLGQSLEGDRFSGFFQRYNTDLGAKYFLYKLDKDILWFAEAGYRFSRENSTNGTSKNAQKARLYSEAEKFWSKSTSTKLWVEYIPNFTVSQAWLLNGEASVSSALDSTFAVKSAYLVKYNNNPASSGVLKTDTVFTTSLVAKF
jgi:putative salt-induced outer membrane protein